MRALVLASLAASAAGAAVMRKPNNATGLCGPDASFAGYVDITNPETGNNKSYWYWQFDAPGAASSSAPVLLWLTGGPGCSSSVAALLENGPCHVNDDGNATTPNPYSWHLAPANVIYLDQPAGVGYSSGSFGGLDSNETEVAGDVYEFLQGWFRGNPDFAGRPFFLFGESYAGHYVPAVSKRIVDGNAALAPGDVHINFQALAIGNGLTRPDMQYETNPTLAYNYSIEVQGKPVITLQQYETLMANAPNCNKLIDACEAGNSGDCLLGYEYCNAAMLSSITDSTGISPYNIKEQCTDPPLCTDTSGLVRFMNRPETQSKLGVEWVLWMPCQPLVEELFIQDWLQRFDTDVAYVINAGVRALIYAGELDLICNSLGNLAWADAMVWPGQGPFAAKPLAPWYAVPGENATGLVKRYHNFAYLRGFGGGHMYPGDQPAAALQLVRQWIGNTLGQ